MTLAQRFLALPPEQRRLAFEQAAGGRPGRAVILEKDFWVSWLLGVLFAQPGLRQHLVFKGGTALFKVFRVIERFSEDIDLCLAPGFIGADAAGFERLASRGRRDAAVLQMRRLCEDAVRDVLVPALETAIDAALGPAPAGRWLSCEHDADAKFPIVRFHYPVTQPAGFEVLRREVKLELGALGDQEPTGHYPVRPLLADAAPHLFDGWSAEVTALELRRTFWEKATILHCEYHRPADHATPAHYARHYFDMARLLQHPQAPTFLADQAQCARVVDWKARTFARAWARYDLARPGSFRLVPPPQRHAALAQDYADLRPTFLSEPPAFEALLQPLAQAEAVLNA